MDKDALGTKKESTNSKSSQTNAFGASPLVLILAIFAVIVLALIFFKDKLIKNKFKNLEDLVKKQKDEKPLEKKVEEKKQENVTPKESTDLQDKFAKK